MGTYSVDLLYVAVVTKPLSLTSGGVVAQHSMKSHVFSLLRRACPSNVFIVEGRVMDLTSGMLKSACAERIMVAPSGMSICVTGWLLSPM